MGGRSPQEVTTTQISYSTLHSIPDTIPFSFPLFLFNTWKKGAWYWFLCALRCTQNKTPIGLQRSQIYGALGLHWNSRFFSTEEGRSLSDEPQLKKKFFLSLLFVFLDKRQKREREKKTFLASKPFRRNQLEYRRLGCWGGSPVNRFFRASVSICGALISPVDLYSNL